MKFLKILILVAIPLGIWLWINNFPSGYYLDQGALFYRLYISFFNDLALPFALYFGFCLFEKWIPRLKPWQTKVLVAFLIPASLEIGQLLFEKLDLSRLVLVYGGAFDLWDLVAYAAGGLLAALLERKIFSNHFKFWEQTSLTTDQEALK